MSVMGIWAARPKGARRYALLAVLALVPTLAVFWAVGRLVDESRTAASDSQLNADLQVTRSVLESDIANAARKASALARLTRIQRAFAQNDAARLRDLANSHPGAQLISEGGAVAGAIPGRAVRETIEVTSARRTVGRVVIAVPIDSSFLARVRASAAIGAHDLVVITDSGRVVAGPMAKGTGLAVGSAQDVSVHGHQYRAIGARLAKDLPNVRAVSLSPVSGGLTTGWRLPLAILATLVFIAALVWGVARLFRVSAAGRSTRPIRQTDLGRRDAFGIVSLLGETLAATHDSEALLAVILDAAIEATGAAGGKLVAGNDPIVAASGKSRSRPLILSLDMDQSDRSHLVLFPPPGGFSPEASKVADWLAVQAGIAFENARLHGIVQEQAITDELTGLANRRHFMARLEAALAQAKLFGIPVAVLLCDLDDFKLVNDRFGHTVGDEVLKAFGRAIGRCMRDTDVAARIGGEEFAVLLPETDADGAARFASRLRTEFRSEPSLPDRVTASFGISSYPVSNSAEAMLVDADAGLYQAKASGKDRIVVSQVRRSQVDGS